jgi:hypothetical protein
VLIKGKRRATPVLFSPDVQQNIDLLLKLRNSFISEQNMYLFANHRTKNQPIVGYKTLAKYCERAHLENPLAITSRRLRKHLATISQLLSMNDQDIEQLSTFMGHTSGVHKMEYRLPDNVFQTAKVAKMLLMMEGGTTKEFAGKTLNEIEVNLEENLMDITSDNESSGDECEGGKELLSVLQNPQPGTSKDATSFSSVKPKRILTPGRQNKNELL